MNLNDALKYQQRDRLTVAQIHPSLRFTPVSDSQDSPPSSENTPLPETM